MNKTLTINISGIIFHIEEDAYESLSRYLARIEGFFSNTDGGNEIMSDIEARVAELLQEKLNQGKQVILKADVDYVMQVMGRPEDFGGEEQRQEQNNKQDSTSQTTAEQTHEKIRRRLFRNSDDKMIGGVCSGLAAYLDIDTVWVRLAMVLLVWPGGLSLWVYIIMWMIIPEAKTTADRYAMRGESANINNIMKNFQEEAKDMQGRINKYGKEFRNSGYGESVRSNFAAFLAAVFNILGRLVGFFVLLVGLVLLAFYVFSLTGITVIDSTHNITQWKTALLESHFHYALAVLSFIIVLGIPTFMLIYAGVRMLFRIRYSNRWLNLSLGLIWTVGLIIGVYVTVMSFKNFSESTSLKDTEILRFTGDTLVVKINPASKIVKQINADNIDDVEKFLEHNHNGIYFPSFDNKIGLIRFANLDITENNNDSTELETNRDAKGMNKKEAKENAGAIKYNYKLEKNTLWLDEIFFVQPDAKFRDQEVNLKLRLPKGKVITLDKSLRHMLYDVDNTTNTSDGDMVARRWKMTDKGLECIDCNNLDSGSRKRHKREIVIEMGDGIQVKNQNTHVKIDENGVEVNDPEAETNHKNDDNKDKED